jgi:hypothetical protein
VVHICNPVIWNTEIEGLPRQKKQRYLWTNREKGSWDFVHRLSSCWLPAAPRVTSSLALLPCLGSESTDFHSQRVLPSSHGCLQLKIHLYIWDCESWEWGIVNRQLKLTHIYGAGNPNSPRPTPILLKRRRRQV